jgi:hypothetical protein
VPKSNGLQKHDGRHKVIVAKLGVIVGDYYMNSMSQMRGNMPQSMA